MNWRWDQGRLDYFRFDNIVRIARVLVDLENVDLRTSGTDPLRSALMSRTGLPFAPAHYRVWRNYGRVFACSFLATSLNNRLAITDVCRQLAAPEIGAFDVDDYLAIFVRKFACPFPAFDDYAPRVTPSYPMCAVLKYLIAKRSQQNEPFLDIDDVFSFIIGNHCTGTEPLEHYLTLRRTNREPSGDERRQVRELLIFCSQLNALKWFDNRLFLDIDVNDNESFSAILDWATPIPTEPAESRSVQLMRVASIPDEIPVPIPSPTREMPSDLIFTEGKRIRVSHLRAERSPRLRKIYFEMFPSPYLCDMCNADLDGRYPWTTNMLELHHLLPLSSAIRIDTHGTNLSDVQPVCPNCHKSIHVFYGEYLRSRSLRDFTSKDEAHSVYDEVKRGIVL